MIVIVIVMTDCQCWNELNKSGRSRQSNETCQGRHAILKAACKDGVANNQPLTIMAITLIYNSKAYEYYEDKCNDSSESDNDNDNNANKNALMAPAAEGSCNSWNMMC